MTPVGDKREGLQERKGRAERHHEQLVNAPEPVHICVWSDCLSHSYRDVLWLADRVGQLTQELQELRADFPVTWEERQRRVAAERRITELEAALKKIDKLDGRNADLNTARYMAREAVLSTSKEKP